MIDCKWPGNKVYVSSNIGREVISVKVLPCPCYLIEHENVQRGIVSHIIRSEVKQVLNRNKLE